MSNKNMNLIIEGLNKRNIEESVWKDGYLLMNNGKEYQHYVDFINAFNDALEMKGLRKAIIIRVDDGKTLWSRDEGIKLGNLDRAEKLDYMNYRKENNLGIVDFKK